MFYGNTYMDFVMVMLHFSKKMTNEDQVIMIALLLYYYY